MQNSDAWVVEYSPSQDSFGVRMLADYLSRTHEAFLMGQEMDWIILAIHPDESVARDECNVWMDRRAKHPIDDAQKAGRLLRSIALHLGEEAQHHAGVELKRPPKVNRE